MTLINVDLEDSGKQPLVGYINVTLDYRLNTDSGRSLQPVTRKYVLDVLGQATLDLEPSEVAQVSYLFEVYRSVTVGLVTTDTLIDSFHATVPASITPILWTDLARQTDITKNDQDASLVSVVRRLLSYNEFWLGLSQNVFKPKGSYSASTYYILGDVVSFNGNGYVNASPTSIINTPPNPSGDNDTWKLLVSKGATGSGTTGDTAAYDPLVWVDSVAPSRNAVKDIIETLARKTELTTLLNNAFLTGTPVLSAAIPAADNTSRPSSTAWVQSLVAPLVSAQFPIGAITDYAGSSVPTGWLLCDGRVLSRTTYVSLFNAIGTVWNTGGETGSQFRIPDFRGRVLACVDTSPTTGAAGRLSGGSLAANGGASTVTLTTANMPAHTHVLASASGNVSQFTATGLANASGTGYYALNNTASGTGTISPQSNGSGTAFSNMPPYAVANTIIYAGV